MASTEMFAGIALQRLLLGILAVILAVAWTVLFWPAVLPVLETVSGAEVVDGSAQRVAEAGVSASMRFSAAALLTMVMPVLAYASGVIWFRSTANGLRERTLHTLITVFLAAGLASLGTFGPGLVAPLFGDGAPAEAFLGIASDHVSVPVDRVLAMVLTAGASTTAVLILVLIVALFTAPSSRIAPQRRRFSSMGWLVLPVVGSIVAGLAVGLTVPMPR